MKSILEVREFGLQCLDVFFVCLHIVLCCVDLLFIFGDVAESLSVRALVYLGSIFRALSDLARASSRAFCFGSEFVFQNLAARVIAAGLGCTIHTELEDVASSGRRHGLWAPWWAMVPAEVSWHL